MCTTHSEQIQTLIELFVKKRQNWYPHIGGFVQVPQYIDCTKWNTCYKINLKLYL
jgi:hypothetical protein